MSASHEEKRRGAANSSTFSKGEEERFSLNSEEIAGKKIEKAPRP